ncbi:MAG: GtrA family protein [Pseudomonadota bacterium]
MVFFWYTLAGGIATAAHYVVLLVLVEIFGLSPAPSAVAGALVGAAVSYMVNRRITFPGSTVRHQSAVPRFLAVAGAGALVNGVVVWTGVHWLSWHYLAAQVLASLIVLCLTYSLNRYWTFAR